MTYYVYTSLGGYLRCYRIVFSLDGIMGAFLCRKEWGWPAIYFQIKEDLVLGRLIPITSKTAIKLYKLYGAI